MMCFVYTFYRKKCSEKNYREYFPTHTRLSIATEIISLLFSDQQMSISLPTVYYLF